PPPSTWSAGTTERGKRLASGRRLTHNPRTWPGSRCPRRGSAPFSSSFHEVLMRWNVMLSLLMSATLAAPALASMGSGGSPKEPETPASATEPASESQPGVRQQAEHDYSDAYNEIAKAKQDLENNKG